MALSHAEQQRVWEGLYSAHVRSYYYAHLSLRYQRHQTFITWLTLLSSSGAAASFLSTTLAGAYRLVPPLLSIGTGALSLYSLVAKKERKGVDSSRLSTKYAQLMQAYSVLFGEMNSATSDRLQKLEEKGVELSEAAHSLVYKKKLMVQSQQEVKVERGLP